MFHALPLCFPGITVNITLGVRLLQMSLAVPDEHTNNVEGLLGNLNGDPTDDYMPRTRTSALPSNSTEKEIFFTFGQTCTFLIYTVYVGTDASCYT